MRTHVLECVTSPACCRRTWPVRQASKQPYAGSTAQHLSMNGALTGELNSLLMSVSQSSFEVDRSCMHADECSSACLVSQRARAVHNDTKQSKQKKPLSNHSPMNSVGMLLGAIFSPASQPAGGACIIILQQKYQARAG